MKRRSKIMIGLKWNHLRHWRAMKIKAPVVVSLNGAPKAKYPVIDFEVGVDGGSFGTMNRIDKMPDKERVAFVAHWGRVSPPLERNPWDAQTHARKAKHAIWGLGRMWVGWVGPQDMMVEDFMLEKTGLTVLEHQRRTVENYVALCELGPDIPWLPVLQGQTLADYLTHVEMYRAVGVDLSESEWVGVGSMCRRQGTIEAATILAALIRRGLRVHALGVKADGLKMLRMLLTPWQWENMVRSDSAAWSSHAFHGKILMDGHYHGDKTKNCANCPTYANVRRQETEASIWGSLWTTRTSTSGSPSSGAS